MPYTCERLTGATLFSLPQSLTFPDAASTVSNKKIQFAAHSIKGMCLLMGAQALTDEFGEVERDAKANNFANADSRNAQIRELGMQSLHALKTLSAKHQAAANGR